MTDQKKDQQMDELLDALLTQYSAAKPRPGLETRILAHIRGAAPNATPSSPWNFKWAWAAVAALAAVIVGSVLIGFHRKAAVPPAIVHVSQPLPAQPNQPGPPQKTNAANHPPRRHVQPNIQSASLPIHQRPGVFPTPEPLSEEEKLLVRYVARTPHEELVAQSRPFEPFHLEDKSGSIIQKPKESTETR